MQKNEERLNKFGFVGMIDGVYSIKSSDDPKQARWEFARIRDCLRVAVLCDGRT